VQQDGSRLPTWNPVLFQPKNGPLMLFYKVGPSPKDWWGMVMTSDDDGKTWSGGRRIGDGLLGPIKNKPIQLENGTIICPTSVERIIDVNDDGLRAAGGATSAVLSSTQSQPSAGTGWDVYFELSDDNGKTFHPTPLVKQPPDIKAIQPSILIHSQTRLQAIGRTQKNRRLFQVWSEDGGRTWGEMSLLDLPNCNSGTDAVTLSDRSHLLVYNHSDTEKVRYPLNVAISKDGTKWQAACTIESEPPGQYSYPAVVQSRDGLVHIAYTWKRLRMRHAVVDPSKVLLRDMANGAWPPGL
jgi:predicted neuraminidase